MCLEAGHTYHLRFELEQLTDPDANESSDTSMYQHRVTFAQECLVKVTNAPGNRLALDLEVKAVEMERAKGPFVVLAYDSERGGERSDDLGYVPVLDKFIGGHLRFQLSPDGRVMRADGLNEWPIARSASRSAPTPTPARDRGRGRVASRAPLQSPAAAPASTAPCAIFSIRTCSGNSSSSSS